MIILQRMCWNTDGWQSPTGSVYHLEGGDPGKTGIGQEEWNFNTTDVVDGYVYGYMYRPPTQPGPHDIFFFTKQPKSSITELIGVYRNAHIPDKAEKQVVSQAFKDLGYAVRRAQEVASLNIPGQPATIGEISSNLTNPDFFAVKVKPADIQVFSPRRPCTAPDLGLVKKLAMYYSTYTLLPQEPSSEEQHTSPTDGAQYEPLPTDAYQRFTPEQMKTIERLHNDLSNRFRKWLKNHGATNIKKEVGAIDVTCSYQGKRYLFELKVCRGTAKMALREALGQVLDYRFYPGQDKQDFLAIVVNQSPVDKDLYWLNNISQQGLVIDCFWLKGNGLFQSTAVSNSALTLKASQNL